MVHPNFVVLGLATLIPIIVGFFWYNPKFGFGNVWMRASGITPDSEKKNNMAVVFGLTIVFSFMFALILQTIVVHQINITGFLTQQKDYAEGSKSAQLLKDIGDNYGTTYRTFKHGLFHGILTALFIVLPVIGVNALFEGRGFKYIAVNTGYWIVSIGLMGGVICAFT